MIPICVGCGRLGCSLGDDRFCASCLRLLGAQSAVGLDLIYDYLCKVDAFETYCVTRGATA